MPGQVWTATEFEMFAVKYREELETFLYTVYHHCHAQIEPLPPPSRHKLRR